MSTARLFPERTIQYRIAKNEGRLGATVELLLAGGTVWANNAEYLRAELLRYGLQSTEVDLGPTHGGTRFKLR